MGFTWGLPNFLYQEFGKIYFIMNIKHNMDLKNKNKNLRKWKSQYIDKFNKNDINIFISDELILDKNLSALDMKVEFGEFLNAMLDIPTPTDFREQVFRSMSSANNNLLSTLTTVKYDNLIVFGDSEFY